MIQIQVIIVNKLGLHARAASKFVALAERYVSDITLTFKDDSVNGKSIMAVIMLVAGQGSVINIAASGKDEIEAVKALSDLVNNYFEEDE